MKPNFRKNHAALAFALAPYRAAFVARIEAHLAESVRLTVAEVEAAGWDANAVAPHPTGNMGRVAYRAAVAKYGWVRKWTESNWGGSSKRPSDPDTRKAIDPATLAKRLAVEAEKAGGGDFDAYVVKLAKKLEASGAIEAASFLGQPWEGSTLRVTFSNGTQQVWTTRVIINRSIYGKLFNQWPTRRQA